jgi:hypothetical protein
MFKAVRDSSATAGALFHNHRLQRTARLFLFELTVVIIGVLIAQGLANWAQSRSGVDRMRRSDARARLEAGQVLNTVLIWQKALPCLDARLKLIMQKASEGAIPPGLADRPMTQDLVLSPLSDDDALLMRAQMGDRHVELIDGLLANVGNFNRHVVGIGSAWGRILLADPRFGSVSAADRAEARASAADIREHLRGMGFIASEIVDRTRELGARPINDDPGFGPARTCDSIWKSGRINPPLRMG